MQLTFLGTGDARQVPVFGCDCSSCQRAQQLPLYRRTPCSALIQSEGDTLLLDAGQCHLEHRFRPGELTGILLTHYHMDHVQGLFPLRWGTGVSIPVFGPPDKTGCDDLFKHPGLLDFRPPVTPFVSVTLGALQVTPVPLIHSRLTYGYLLQYRSRSLAWLCDTAGLPAESEHFLCRQTLNHLVLDCSHPPSAVPPRNHNDVTRALDITRRLKPEQCWLTHIGHDMDNWLAENPLPPSMAPACDGMMLTL